MNWLLLGQIFLINLLYITLNTIRVILTMRGYRKAAPLLAIIEVTIYTLGLSLVIEYLSNPIYLVAYALGFGVGIYTGMMIEDRLALGYSVVYIITDSVDHTLADSLRKLGYGVTIQTGYGRDGERLVLTVLTPRSTEIRLFRAIEEISPTAFYYSFEAKYIQGGFWTKNISPQEIAEAPLPEEIMAEEEDFMSKEEYQEENDLKESSNQDNSE
jgi:uncharacterized protein YebE (UPF0316 family)